MDVECVRMTAIKSLFDLIHVYGLGAFEDAAEDECHNSDSENDKSSEAVERSGEGQDGRLEGESVAAEHSQSGWSKAASSLIAILSSTLDSEVRKGLSAFHVHLPKVPCTSIVGRNVHFMFSCPKCAVLYCLENCSVHVHMPKVSCTCIVWRNVQFMFTCPECPVLVFSHSLLYWLSGH